MEDATQRFTNRVENYLRYRPGYPATILPFLKKAIGLTPAKIIADIGAGTGISAELFLQNGNKVFAVEPNDAMRNAAEKLLNKFPGYVSVKGTAERTGLVSSSVDIIMAAQAFHWFDPDMAKKEFKRILKKSGYVILLWNERKTDTPFLQEYEELILRYATDYSRVDHRNITPEIIQSFLAPAAMKMQSFENEQALDWEGFKGRLLSSSYMPAAGQPAYEPMINDLQQLFEKYAQQHIIHIAYDTKIYYAQWSN